MPLSNFIADAVLTSYFEEGTPFVALYNGNPGNDGLGGTDVTETINVAGRVAVTFSTPVSRVTVNEAEVSFGMSAGATDVTHFGLWDAATGGNFLGSAALSASRTVAAGDPVSFLIGDLSVNLPG